MPLEWLFGRRMTPEEMLRKNKRALDKAIRDLDRERLRMEQQEKKIIADIKKMAKDGQMEKLRAAQALIPKISSEHTKSHQTLTGINSINETVLKEEKISPMTKHKLKSMYNTALEDARQERASVEQALKLFYDIRQIRNDRRLAARQSCNKETLRRGTLMKMLQTSAQTLPLWMGKTGESVPPLCGAIPPEPHHYAKTGDMVAALVRGSEGEDNWILAEVVHYHASSGKYELDDIDEEQKEKLHLSRRRVIPLPIMRANPETDHGALYPKNAVVMALYPQTTCFYKAVVNIQPATHKDEYEVLFEDSTYPEGFSPSLKVPQRYIIAFKDKKSK